ncbi:hypothetical protein CDAR_434541 [Caerostris darwini]|uniref:Uncharacterized protein n=1 Tax=Caerostris darwini TaxID=1538125 RepID=A0AAV4PKZ1_9ARAC|nr:hypothetical protein CDAR_434541 [Caerostris darwini]
MYSMLLQDDKYFKSKYKGKKGACVNIRCGDTTSVIFCTKAWQVSSLLHVVYLRGLYKNPMGTIQEIDIRKEGREPLELPLEPLLPIF